MLTLWLSKFHAWLDRLIDFLTPKNVKARRRREHYEFLKAEISKRHFDGFAGLVVDFPGRRFRREDIACFGTPMYQAVRNKDMKWCIFWDRSRMSREIGVGQPLKEGEALISDVKVRTHPDSNLETIDERKPLTQTLD